MLKYQSLKSQDKLVKIANLRHNENLNFPMANLNKIQIDSKMENSGIPKILGKIKIPKFRDFLLKQTLSYYFKYE